MTQNQSRFFRQGDPFSPVAEALCQMIGVVDYDPSKKYAPHEVQYDLVLDALGIQKRLAKAQKATEQEASNGAMMAFMWGPPPPAPEPSALLTHAFWENIFHRLLQTNVAGLQRIRLCRLIHGAQLIYEAYAPMAPHTKLLAGWDSGSGLEFRQQLREYVIDTTRHPEITTEQAKLVNTAFRLAASA